MKKAILVLMSSVIATQASVATATTSLVVNKGLISEESSVQRIEDMSNEEILAGIQDLSVILASMKNDLKKAEAVEGRREVAVKVVTYSTATTAGSLIAALIFHTVNRSARGAVDGLGSAAGRLASLGVALLASVSVAAGATYLLLTEDQVADIEAKIKVAEAQLEELKARLVR